MNKRSLICHSVAVLVTVIAMLFSTDANANAMRCVGFFSYKAPRLMEGGVQIQRDVFTKSEVVMDKLENEGILKQLKTSNPSKDHIDFLSDQLPLIAQKLTIKFSEALPYFRRGHIPHGKILAEKLINSKESLQKNLTESFEMLLEEAASRIESKTVTYEWYMNFFLKSIIFSDVSLRTIEATSSGQFESLNKKLYTVLGKSKVFSSENLEELRLYAALGKEFSSLTKDAYFTRHLLENTMVPVLFTPKDADIIRAERLGLHFVTLATSAKETVDGKKYPLQLAARQIEQTLVQANGFKDLITNNKSKWIKNHDKIVAKIKGDSKLEALYAFILRDAGLQPELTKRFDIGYRVIFSFDSHKTSSYLKEYFEANHARVSKVADQSTIDSFLRIIFAIEKEALASKSHK